MTANETSEIGQKDKFSYHSHFIHWPENKCNHNSCLKAKIKKNRILFVLKDRNANTFCHFYSSRLFLLMAGNGIIISIFRLSFWYANKSAQSKSTDKIINRIFYSGPCDVILVGVMWARANFVQTTGNFVSSGFPAYKIKSWINDILMLRRTRNLLADLYSGTQPQRCCQRIQKAIFSTQYVLYIFF